jgi:hypothetical protein
MTGKNGHGGKRTNAGRKSKAEELGLHSLLDECWTEADRRACVKKLAQDAKSRDFKQRHEARKLLLAYAFGKPKELHEHSGPDGGAIPVAFTNAVVKIYGRKS